MSVHLHSILHSNEPHFLFSYDGDVNIPNAPQTAPEPVKLEQPNIAADATASHDVKSEATDATWQAESKQDQQFSNGDGDQKMYGNGHDEEAVSTWDGGAAQGMGGHGHGAHGPGIKEDG